MRVRTLHWLARDVVGMVLESIDETALPIAAPGSHVSLFLRPGLQRAYSVVGNGGLSTCYEIAVAKSPNSTGGSRYVHEKVRVGDLIEVSSPRNLFALDETASASVLVAGGIGITPIYSMVQRLEALEKPWHLLYATRSRDAAAYLTELETLAARTRVGMLRLHFDDQAGGYAPDLDALIANAPAGTHVYCCGPSPMLAAFQAASMRLPPTHVHLERFTAGAAVSAPGEAARNGFQVVLARSNRRFDVPPDKSILDVLLDHGIDAQYGCMQGVCGACATSVLDGRVEPVAGDVIQPEGVDGHTRILLCQRHSATPVLTLDL